jgi:hypothetical protein
MTDQHRTLLAAWKGLGFDPAYIRFDRRPRSAADFWISPFDMFAIAGILIDEAAVYRHVFSAEDGAEGWFGIKITPDLREEIKKVGEDWRENASDGTPEAIHQWWSALWQHRGMPVATPQRGEEPPEWWLPALKLFLASDEAARGLDKEYNNFLSLGLAGDFEGVDDDEHAFVAIESLSDADLAIVRVLPKQQTPSVGCSMRSLSMHLALLRSGDELAIDWTFHTRSNSALRPKTSNGVSLAEPLNLILLPWPYAVSATEFRAGPVRARALNREESTETAAPWGWFDLKPQWARLNHDRLFDFVDGLLRAARRSVGPVHGVILPELALDWDAFLALAKHLEREPDLEVLISGSTEEAYTQKPGNHVHGAYFKLSHKDDVLLTTRAKHHRWKLNRDQIRAYSLGASLDPAREWWEHIELLNREMNFVSLRPDLVLTTMICEDLARIDPCQHVLRATGPSLIVALLMDGPQLSSRWPGRYATILADDPGSAVLTLTSLGLIERQNASGSYGHSNRKIALWKDEITGFREIELSQGADAMCITVSQTPMVDRSLDGREDKRKSLSLSGVTPLKSDAPRP